MRQRRIIGFSGLALALAGLFCLPPVLLDGWHSIVNVGARDWWIVKSSLATSHAFVLLGLAGLAAAQLRQAGALTALAYAVAVLGNAAAAATRIVELTVLPVMAANPDTEPFTICTPFFPPATQSAASFVARACESAPFELMRVFAFASMASLAAGTMLLGVSIVVARSLPALCGLLLGLAGIAALVAGIYPNVPGFVAVTGFVALAAGYLWTGVYLLVHRPGG